MGYLYNPSNETTPCIFQGTSNLYEFFFHLFRVTMNKHSENGRKEKQQQGAGKNNTLSGSINKLIKARAQAQALAGDSTAPSHCSARHGVGEVQVLAHSWVRVTLLHWGLAVRV